MFFRTTNQAFAVLALGLGLASACGPAPAVRIAGEDRPAPSATPGDATSPPAPPSATPTACDATNLAVLLSESERAQLAAQAGLSPLLVRYGAPDCRAQVLWQCGAGTSLAYVGSALPAAKNTRRFYSPEEIQKNVLGSVDVGAARGGEPIATLDTWGAALFTLPPAQDWLRAVKSGCDGATHLAKSLVLGAAALTARTESVRVGDPASCPAPQQQSPPAVKGGAQGGLRDAASLGIAAGCDQWIGVQLEALECPDDYMWDGARCALRSLPEPGNGPGRERIQQALAVSRAGGEKAQAALLELLDLYPAHFGAKSSQAASASVLAARHFLEAEGAGAPAAEPKRALSVWQRLATALEELGRDADSLAALRELSERYPRSEEAAEATLKFAARYCDRGKEEQARLLYRQVAQANRGTKAGRVAKERLDKLECRGPAKY